MRTKTGLFKQDLLATLVSCLNETSQSGWAKGNPSLIQLCGRSSFAVHSCDVVTTSLLPISCRIKQQQTSLLLIGAQLWSFVLLLNFGLTRKRIAKQSCFIVFWKCYEGDVHHVFCVQFCTSTKLSSASGLFSPSKVASFSKSHLKYA